jgi:2-oxoglutarate ferredoxin oxidoreductase subunit alpha
MEPGIYRKITGNEALALGLVASTQLSGREMVFGGYPITPASDIIEELSKHKHFGIKTVQAEDEIAGIGVAIGASLVVSIVITATSGPGLLSAAGFITTKTSGTSPGVKIFFPPN